MRSTDVVDLTDVSSFEDCENSAAIVFHVQPIALLFAVTVNGKWLALERIGDHQGQEFFWKLVWTIVVRGARDQSRKFVGAHVRANQEVRGGLGGRIRATRLERRFFVGVSSWLYIAVNFIGGNMKETRYREPARYLEESKCSGDVGLNYW